jgi:alkylation response protein AidB-like acyl-CoA dehydrogenase
VRHGRATQALAAAIAAGEQVAAFLLTELDIGSDAGHVTTRVEDNGGDLVPGSGS